MSNKVIMNTKWKRPGGAKTLEYESARRFEIKLSPIMYPEVSGASLF